MADCKTAKVHNGKVQEGTTVRLLPHHAIGKQRVSKVVRITRLGLDVQVYTEDRLDDREHVHSYCAYRLEIVNPDGSANASKAIHDAINFGSSPGGRRKGRR